MFLKRILIGIAGVGLIAGCTNNNLEDSTVDCTASTLDFVTTITDANCGQSDGSITITASGGDAPYMYALDDGALVESALLGNLPAGNYTVSVYDANMCSRSNAVSIGNKSGFQATTSVTDAGCKSTNGSITAQPTGGVAPYAYQLNGGAAQSSASFSGLSAGDYEVLITDAVDCSFIVLSYVPNGTSFSASVEPIIASSCATTNCHDGSTSQTNFSIFSNVQSHASSIKSLTQSGSMPKNGTLTQAQKDAIACWVDDGALDN